MPELPEVLTTISELRPRLLGAAMDAFSGQALAEIDNLGKYIVFTASSGEIMVIHLGMTGSLLFFEKHPFYPNQKPFQILPFRVGTCEDNLYLFDARRFSKQFFFGSREAMLADRHFNRIGPTFLDWQSQASIHLAVQAYQRHPGFSIKEALLDQKLTSGAGNIYATEALWNCGVHPLELIADLSSDKVFDVLCMTRSLLYKGVKNKGYSFSDFVRPSGVRGEVHDTLDVFQKAGKPCPRCGKPISRKEISGRGAYGCYEKCQILGAPAPPYQG